MAVSSMPHGWDLRRIRDLSGDQSAEALNTERAITADPTVLPDVPHRAASVFAFHDLVVVQLSGADQWHMGTLDRPTGSIHLWTTYGDFGEALEGL
jgi:hypothetical protein